MSFTVEGVKITDEQISSVNAEMLAMGRFTYTDVMSALIKSGVQEGVHYRAADRYLQMSKRKGLIAFGNKFWRWYGNE